MQLVLLCNTLIQRLTYTWINMQSTNKKVHTSCYKEKPDLEAHHQEREVQKQNVEKGRKLNAYIGTISCKATRKENAMLCHI